jgi:predicted nucleic acid-binding protein
MSAESPREFVDSNILVYASDPSAGDKQKAAQVVVVRQWVSGRGCLSVQVLQEFFVTVTKKIPEPLSVDEAAAHVSRYSTWKMFAPIADDVLAAIRLSQEAQLNFGDAMIVHAAAESGCGVLWTEDLNHGQIVHGIEIRSPFLDEAIQAALKEPSSPA